MSTFTFRSGQEPLFFECDLLKRESIDHLFSTIASKVPSGIDILVNNAGKLTLGDITILTYVYSVLFTVAFSKPQVSFNLACVLIRFTHTNINNL